MKKLIRNTYTFIFYLLLFAALILFSSCEKNEPISDREVFIENLANTWEVDEESYIQINNQDITQLLLGFEIAIDKDLNYVTNVDELQFQEFPWGTEGSFTLSEDLTTLTRNDGLVITIDIGEDGLSIDLEFDAEDDSGRLAGISGSWKCGMRRR